MTETTNGQTRRTFIAGLFALFAITHSGAERVRGAVGYSIEFVETLAADAVTTPTEYSYELVQWQEQSVLRFDDERPEHTVFEFGDDRPKVNVFQNDTFALPGGINIPLELDLSDMEEATAFFLSGVMAILLGATAVFKNPAAGVMWSVSFVVLVVAGLFGFSLQLYWLSIIMTVLLIMVGMVVRWSR